MQLTSAIAIYFLFWFLCLFLVLPFRLRSSDEHDPHVPGQAESAPPRFSVTRTVTWTSILSAAMFGLFYANFVFGWVTVDDLDLFTPAAQRDSR
jgi:predicted secreted protein